MGFFRIWDIWVKYEQDSGSLKINMVHGILRSDKMEYRVGKSLIFATGINRVRDIMAKN